MKRFISMTSVGLLILGVALCGSQAKAQSGSNDSGQAQRGGMGRPHRMSADQQLQRLSERLNLTDEQKGQIKPILEDRQKQMEAIHSDNSLSQDQMRSKTQAVFEDSNTKIRAVLNDEQKQKYDQMQQRMREGMHRHDGADSKQAPPQ